MKNSLRRALPNSPLLPALLAFVMASSLCFLYARSFNFNLTAFVSAGHPTADARQLPSGFFLQPHRGHDGQFYYRLALNPLTSTRTSDGITLDNPAYRQQRVFYPTAVYFLSFGQKNLVPFALIAVNVLALTILGWQGGIWARHFGIHAIWGVLLALHPGFLFSLWLDLTEILQAALAIGALLALQNRRQFAAALLLSLAVLTKETALLFAIAAFILWIWQKRSNGLSRENSSEILGTWESRTLSPRAISPLLFALPIAIYLAWQIAVFSVWQKLPATSGTNNLGAPLVGVFDLIAQRGTPFNLGLVTTISLFTFAVSHRLKSAPILRLVKVAWLLYGALAICLSFAVWSVDVNFLRALSEYSICGLLVVMAQSSWRMRAVFALTMFAIIAVRANMVLQLM